MPLISDYTLDSLRQELAVNLESVEDLITHPALKGEVYTQVHAAILCLREAAEALELQTFLDEGGDDNGWRDGVMQEDGTIHLKPVVKSAATSAAAFNKALAEDDEFDKFYAAGCGTTSSRWVTTKYGPPPPKGVKREVLTPKAYLDLGVFANASTPVGA